jgi:hypothetical protein
MTNIEAKFNDSFSDWDIRLPPDAVDQRKRGKIVQAGWVIWYLFSSDEKGDYLDYYASHRMTDDDHVRIYTDGLCEELPAIRTFCLRSKDPQEDSRLEAEYYAENQKISRMLDEKGFGITGGEPGGVQINRFLHFAPSNSRMHDKNTNLAFDLSRAMSLARIFCAFMSRSSLTLFAAVVARHSLHYDNRRSAPLPCKGWICCRVSQRLTTK